MPKKTFIVETDKGSYEVDVDMPLGGVSPKADAAGGPDLPFGLSSEGFAQGAKAGVTGFVKGIIPGIVNGVKDTAALPMTILKELAATTIGAGHLASDPEATLRAAADAIANVPGQAAAKLSELADLARQDPEAFGKTVGELTGETGVGIGTSKLVPLAPKPLARRVGNVMETIGKKGEWPIRMMGAHQLGSGNPVGVATMMLPETLQSGGEMLRKWGGQKIRPEVAAKLESQFNDAMTNRNGTAFDEREAARLGAEKTMRGELTDATKEVTKDQKLAAIRTARAGQQAQSPTFSKTTSVDGESMTQKFGAADAATSAGADPMIMGRRLSEYPLDVQKTYRAAMAQTGSTIQAGDPARPPIRVTTPGGNGVSAPNGVRPAPSVIDPEAQAVRDQTAGVTGKAAKLADVASSTDELESIQDAIAGGEAPTRPNGGTGSGMSATIPPSTRGVVPPNLHMGSAASPTEMMADIRARTQGGGIRVDGRRPITVKTGTAPLSADAKKVFDDYMKANPTADAKVVEETLRKLTEQ